MANFTPTGQIKIGRVPFDNSYKHTMTFASREAQTQYFSSVCTENLTKENYTYVRMNNAIRVPFNAEKLYTYNYVMYQNSNYGTKWFYAFITGINYINENATELVLQLDVMQTWYFDYELVEGFVEREHVNDDIIGAHLNSEPAMDLQYLTGDFQQYYATPKYVVLAVNAYPKRVATGGGQTEIRGSYPVSGGQYHNQFSACKYLVYDIVDNATLARLKEDLENYNKAGAAETIADAFTVPFGYLNINELETFGVSPSSPGLVSGIPSQMKDGTTPSVYNFTRSRPTSHKGYVPRNNKLLTYPYCYEEIGDYTGRVEDYRYEFGNSNGSLSFSHMAPVCSDMNLYLWCTHYAGRDLTQATDKPAHAFTVDISNKISWVFSTYETWAAQNQLTNQLAILGSVAAIGASVVPGISAASSILGKGAGMAAMHEGMGNISAVSKTLNAYQNSALRAIPEESNKRSAAAGVGGLAAMAATYDRMSKIPNTAKGNIGGNSRFQSGYAGYYCRQVVLVPELAAIIDGFFDMYGYQVDSVKVPNRTGRPNWNYVKMQNSCHRGNVPADDMAQINAIYDAGITFWHTADIGNYSLPNK